jgi:hypothetical protein
LGLSNWASLWVGVWWVYFVIMGPWFLAFGLKVFSMFFGPSLGCKKKKKFIFWLLFWASYYAWATLVSLVWCLFITSIRIFIRVGFIRFSILTFILSTALFRVSSSSQKATSFSFQRS